MSSIPSRGYVKVRTTNTYVAPRRPKKYAKVRAAAKARRRANTIRMRVIRSKKGR